MIIELRAFQIESMYPNTQVILIPYCLPPHIEFRTNVQVITTCVTTDSHGKHITYIILFISRPMVLR